MLIQNLMIKLIVVTISVYILIMIRFSRLSPSYFTFSTQAKGKIKRVRLGRPGTSLKVGLLGMANIGKSSTFNLLSNMNVPA